jgi:hypothetical protein
VNCDLSCEYESGKKKRNDIKIRKENCRYLTRINNGKKGGDSNPQSRGTPPEVGISGKFPWKSATFGRIRFRQFLQL